MYDAREREREDAELRQSSQMVAVAWLLLFAINFGAIMGSYLESAWIGVIIASNIMIQSVIVTGMAANARRRRLRGERRE